MIDTSKQLSFGLLALAALALSACNPDAAGQIPCVEDISCPNDYPVCGPAGKCIAGIPTATASVAIVGAEGHTAADFLSGTVRVLVTARASTGVRTVALTSGATSFPASATAAAPPLFAFDVNTTTLADGDAPLTATLTTGDGTTGTASGALHVDNAQPVITSFTVAGGGTTATITSGKTVGLTATFTVNGGTATISAGPAGSISLTSGASVLVSPDVQTTYRLTVTSRSGKTVSSGGGATPDVTVSVVSAASKSGNFTVSPTAIAQGDTGNFTFTAPTFGASVVSATIDDGTNPPVPITSGGTVQIAYPATAPGTTGLTYNLVLKNGATVPDILSIPLVVKVNQALPTIGSFVFQASGTTATFNPGDDVILSHVYDAKGGTARINGVIVAGASGGTTTVSNIQSSTVYRLTVTNLDGVSVFSDVTATVNARVNAFSVGTTQATSSGVAVITSGATTKLFASFAGSGASGAAPASLSCSPSCNGTLGATTIGNGGNVTVTGSINGTLTYTLTATSSVGAPATATVTVKVVPPATATSLIATSLLVHQGGSTTLTPVFSFGSSPAVPGTATITGTDGTTYAGLVNGTGIEVAPVVPTVTYTLNVANGAGTPAATTPSVIVSVAPGTWSALNDTVSEIRKGATVSALNTGKVLVAGGTDGTDTPLGTARLCDATGACVSKNMGSPRAFHTAVKIASGTHAGKILLAGGYTAAGPATPTDSAEFFDPATETFSPTTNITPVAPPKPRARHVAVLEADGTTVLIAGGSNGTTDLATAVEYDASTASPTANASGNMIQPRANFTGTLLGNGKVLIAGGKTGNVTAELFNSAGAGSFALTGQDLGEDKRNHTAILIDDLVSLTGKVLISGGTTTAAGGPSTTQFLYDPAADTFTAIASLVTARSNHAATALTTHSILICGGLDTGAVPLKSCERFNPGVGPTGTMFPTAPMLEARTDFGLAPITLSSFVEFLAAGSPVAPMKFAETYNSN